MKHLQTWFKEAYDYSCLAQCYLYITAANSEQKLTEEQTELFILGGLLSGKGLEKEFFVSDPVHLMKSNWKQYADEDIYPTVRKLELDGTTNELRNVEWAAVRYDYNGHSHFVVCHYGLIEWNSLEASQCVLKGKPASARIVEFK